MGFFSHDEFLTALRGCNGAGGELHPFVASGLGRMCMPRSIALDMWPIICIAYLLPSKALAGVGVEQDVLCDAAIAR